MFSTFKKDMAWNVRVAYFQMNNDIELNDTLKYFALFKIHKNI